MINDTNIRLVLSIKRHIKSSGRNRLYHNQIFFKEIQCAQQYQNFFVGTKVAHPSICWNLMNLLLLG